MARIVGSTFGELRGKLGGLVFARNAFGAYARSYVIPVNPNTERQAQARNAFSQSVGSWHTLTDAQKSAWHDYAAQYFSSKRLGNVSGGHTGINAFVSLRNSLINMDRLKQDIASQTLSINSAPVTGLTQASILLPLLPPSQPFQPILAGGDYGIDAVLVTSFNTNGVGQIQFSLVYMGATGASPAAPTPISSNLFVDNNGSLMGLAIYASNALAQASQFVNNPETILISNTGLIDDYTTTPVVPTTISVNFNTNVFSGTQRTTWTLNQYVRFDAWLYNSYGESSRVGSIVTQVTAP